MSLQLLLVRPLNLRRGLLLFFLGRARSLRYTAVAARFSLFNLLLLRTHHLVIQLYFDSGRLDHAELISFQFTVGLGLLIV